MNCKSLLAAVALLLLISPSRMTAQFEGIVESKNLTVDESDSPQEFMMTIWVASGVMRVHNSAIGTAPPTTIIYRNDKRAYWVLNEDEKTYIEVLQDAGNTGEVPDAGEGGKPVMKKTGKTKTILGYRCEQYLLRREGEETEIWGTKQLAGLLRALTAVAQAGEGESWSDELTKIEVFPLLARTKVDGRVVESQEVTKVEARKLSNDLFELPAGYRREVVRDNMQGPQQK